MKTQGCYVYWVAIDGIVRYIGKGTGNRLSSHYSRARALNEKRALGLKAKAHKLHNKMAKAMRDGREITHSIMCDGLTDDEALDIETREILAAPDGQLWNIWAGGLGSSQVSEELRGLLSEAAKKRYADPAEREKTRIAINKARALMPERWAGAADAMRRTWSDPEKRASMSKASADKWKRPGYKEEYAAKVKLYYDSDEGQKASKAKAVHLWGDREAQLKRLAEVQKRPDFIAKKRAYYDSPEGRANLARAAQISAEKRRAKKLAQEATA